MNDQRVEVLLKDEEVHVDEEDDVVPDEALGPQDVGHEEEQEKDVVEVYLIDP